ncbi:unnamed protein product, partial [Owenia fusiformis]
ITNTNPTQTIPAATGENENINFEVLSGNTVLPVNDMKIRGVDRNKLSQELAPMQSVTLSEVKVTVEVDASNCVVISNNGLSIRVKAGLGMQVGLVDRVLHNNVRTKATVECGVDTIDLSVNSFAPSGTMEAEAGYFGKMTFDLTVQADLGGSFSYAAESNAHFVYTLWLSLDATLDMSMDKNLNYDPTSVAALNTELSKELTASGTFDLNSGAGDEVLFPMEVSATYCGSVYLIVEIDSGDNQAESDETNN